MTFSPILATQFCFVDLEEEFLRVIPGREFDNFADFFEKLNAFKKVRLPSFCIIYY